MSVHCLWGMPEHRWEDFREKLRMTWGSKNTALLMSKASHCGLEEGFQEGSITGFASRKLAQTSFPSLFFSVPMKLLHQWVTFSMYKAHALPLTYDLFLNATSDNKIPVHIVILQGWSWDGVVVNMHLAGAAPVHPHSFIQLWRASCYSRKG